MASISPRPSKGSPRKFRTCYFTAKTSRGGENRIPRRDRPPEAESGIVYFQRNFRDYLLDYMSATECPTCHGQRLRPESLAVKVNGMSIAEFTALPIARALETARKIKLTGRDETIAGRILHEIIERLEFLSAVGLGYLSLGRSAATLSGGDLPSDK